jgi:2-polyprenyl-6-methoxyphenol hydroxylase-like FAD-dependent oxidoreductase
MNLNIGLYPNGLRIIRDISQPLLDTIRAQGRPYVYRRWMRHDGSEVAVGEEKYLVKWENQKDQVELASMGIRRWRLQKILSEACALAGIPVIMNQRINSVSTLSDGRVDCSMADGSHISTDFLFGCDGVKSVIRTSLFGSETEPKYTGITCLMGSAPIAEKSPISGICFPSSSTTNCHACFYPCNDKEVIFQLFFPTEERPETWKALSKEESAKECKDLQDMLIKDGWHKMFTDPIGAADSVLRVGLRARNPIPVWHAPSNSSPRIFLLGDAAHPPVPYIGQGAMVTDTFSSLDGH